MLDMETPLQTATQLQHATDNIQQLVTELKARLWEKATTKSTDFPTTRGAVTRGANSKSTNHTAFLINKAGVLDVGCATCHTAPFWTRALPK